ncbi:hypothetical protein F1C15_00840 [Frigoribacterium sp. NBH87]|uniref:hypothetical protein n=1 Tax=Frigoribacterium sp. NBH87 TaxID=2596916 RepID=UPI001628FC98|nr:hypothetical protein [Frigoribacterium sp. NBH87]QNE42566.1 hypothetical protein F1C15_00840 [Frigoribacterium sp. NBH87]
MPESFWGSAIFSVVPSLVVGLIFWFVVRALVRADRNERQAYAAIDKEERERAAHQRGEAPENLDGT